jgi:hypothetical protein
MFSFIHVRLLLERPATSFQHVDDDHEVPLSSPRQMKASELNKFPWSSAGSSVTAVKQETGWVRGAPKPHSLSSLSTTNPFFTSFWDSTPPHVRPPKTRPAPKHTPYGLSLQSRRILYPHYVECILNPVITAANIVGNCSAHMNPRSNPLWPGPTPAFSGSPVVRVDVTACQTTVDDFGVPNPAVARLKPLDVTMRPASSDHLVFMQVQLSLQGDTCKFVAIRFD